VPVVEKPVPPVVEVKVPEKPTLPVAEVKVPEKPTPVVGVTLPEKPVPPVVEVKVPGKPTLPIAEVKAPERPAPAVVVPVPEKPAPVVGVTVPAKPAPVVVAPVPAKPVLDDLAIVEGIGPKIASLFQAAGITTFAQLAATDVARLRQIIREADIRTADPTTWPEQAALAAAGKWDKLKALQEQLTAGRRVVPVPGKPTPDDLAIVEGIGPKIASLFQAAGINTFAQLAATDVERLRQILRAADIRIADPTTWPEQARLAAAGEWDKLKALQEQLRGGRRV
jgi:DNA-directed RNA polymerase subunit beta'